MSYDHHVLCILKVDDVGWADFNYNTEVNKKKSFLDFKLHKVHNVSPQADSPIPTPNIDRLAKSG